MIKVSNVVNYEIIISFLRLRPRGLLQSHTSVWWVFPRSFVLFIGNREFGMESLSGASEEHGFIS